MRTKLDAMRTKLEQYKKIEAEEKTRAEAAIEVKAKYEAMRTKVKEMRTELEKYKKTDSGEVKKTLSQPDIFTESNKYDNGNFHCYISESLSQLRTQSINTTDIVPQNFNNEKSKRIRDSSSELEESTQKKKK